MPRKTILFSITLIIALFCQLSLVFGTEYERVAGTLHTHTKVSDGLFSASEVVEIARRRGLGVVIFTDHSDLEWEYFGVKVKHDSILSYGFQEYLDLVESVSADNPDMIVMAGIEASPFYYWKGGFLEPELRDWTKHLTIYGLKTAEDYEKLPIVAYGTSRFDQMSGEQGVEPYQDLIDYVNKREGLIFWAHLESSHIRTFGSAKMIASPHPEDLIRTYNYTGFEALPASYNICSCPGGYWDQVLLDYCEGRRKKPVWITGVSDFHGYGDIANPTTVLWLKERSSQAVLDALRCGRMYALEGHLRDFILQKFEIRSINGQQSAMSGEEVELSGYPVISIDISTPIPLKGIKLIRDGKFIAEFSTNKIEFLDRYFDPGKKSYYRLEILNKAGHRILSNPIFVRFKRE